MGASAAGGAGAAVLGGGVAAGGVPAGGVAGAGPLACAMPDGKRPAASSSNGAERHCFLMVFMTSSPIYFTKRQSRRN